LIWVVGSYNLLPLVDLLFHLRIRDPHRRGLCRVVCYTRACAAVRMYGLIVFQVFYCAWINKSLRPSVVLGFMLLDTLWINGSSVVKITPLVLHMWQLADYSPH
jgi:hypothetical protein